MDRFLKRKVPSSSTPPIYVTDMNNLPSDPSERPMISEYNVNQRDEIRRYYWLKGPCQPRAHDFPRTMIGNKPRRFISNWFDQYGNWLEYSIKTDRAFCLCCYLFRDHVGAQHGSDAFVTEGFNGWNKSERLATHVGDVNSFHNRALKKCEVLMKEKQSIAAALEKQTDIVKKEYRIRLNATIDACRYLLLCTLPFRGHDESETAVYKRNFLETLKLIGSQNEGIHKVILKKAPGNNQIVSPSIQKDVCNCFATEVINSIFKEIGDDVFSLLIDESSDVSRKEQMAIVLRYVDVQGLVKERFVGLVHSLQDFRVNGFESIVEKSTSFCEKHGIQMLSMMENYVSSRSRRQRANITNRHYYEIECFNTLVDMQIQEFCDRFSETSTELLANMASLVPRDSFSQFDASKLLRLSEFYPYDFDSVETMTLEDQLGFYYDNVSTDVRFSNLNGITDLAKMMVETRKHISYPLVFRLIKLALVLPVATTTVERCFSAMKIVKTDLRNRIGDDFMNDCVICAVERELFVNITNEDVINRFQKMKTRREQM